VLSLPESLRSELKEPAGPVDTDPGALLADAGSPVVAVGDVVTNHLLSVTTPAVALADGRTRRAALPEADTVDEDRFDRRVSVENPPATLARELLETLVTAVERAPETTLIVVDGEEDLAVLPAVVALPDGASVVYGQPDEGMVLVGVDAATRERMTSLLGRMDGDVDGALALLGVEGDGHDEHDG
jgi:uncharacterized protein (UPF0218 family)